MLAENYLKHNYTQDVAYNICSQCELLSVRLDHYLNIKLLCASSSDTFAELHSFC